VLHVGEGSLCSAVMGAPDPVQLLTALTTEHFTLQGARSQTMGETSARASLYMYSVSSVLVALGFVTQVADGVGVVFNVFALTVLPVIYFLGCVTYVRLVECGAEDLRYGMAINRIRGYYKELADDRADLFLLSGHDDAAGVFLNMGLAPDRRSPAFAFSTAVAVINGVVGGALAALALGAVPDFPLWLATVVGVVVAAASVVGWVRHAGRILGAAARQVTPRFPSPATSRD
jgi:hypothetical protein